MQLTNDHSKVADAMVIECVELDPEVNEKLNKFFLKKNGYCEFNPGNVIMPRKLSEVTENISSMNIMKDDVWVISLPRTGTLSCKNIC